MKKCFECGEPAVVEHHIVPRIREGTRTVDLCEKCHNKAHNRDDNLSLISLTKDALKQKKQKRERIGSIPWGYELSKDKIHLLPNINEQKMINIAKKLRNSGLSLNKIGRELISMGYLPRSKGKKWNPKSIRNLINADLSYG